MKKYPIFLLPTGEFRTELLEDTRREVTILITPFINEYTGEPDFDYQELGSDEEGHICTYDGEDTFYTEEYLAQDFLVLIYEDGTIEPYGDYWIQNLEDLRLLASLKFKGEKVTIGDTTITLNGRTKTDEID